MDFRLPTPAPVGCAEAAERIAVSWWTPSDVRQRNPRPEEGMLFPRMPALRKRTKS